MITDEFSMDNKILMTGIIFMIILYGCAYQDGNLRFPKVNIKESHQTCSLDDDCTLISTDCSGCSCSEPVNKDYSDLYKSKRIRLCKKYHGPVCSVICPLTILRCIQGKCLLKPLNASKSEQLMILEHTLNIFAEDGGNIIGEYYSGTGGDFLIELDCGDNSCENLKFGNFELEAGEKKQFIIHIPPVYTSEEKTSCTLTIKKDNTVKESQDITIITRRVPNVYGKNEEVLYTEDSCIYGVAWANNEPELCYKIRDELEIDSCLSRVAYEAKNLAICEEVKNSLLKKSCYNAVLKWTKDPEVCHIIEDEVNRDFCLSIVAYEAKNRTICEEIKTPYYKENCPNRKGI